MDLLEEDLRQEELVIENLLDIVVPAQLGRLFGSQGRVGHGTPDGEVQDANWER